MSASIPSRTTATVRPPAATIAGRAAEPRRVRASLAAIETYLLDRRRELRRARGDRLEAAAIERTIA